MGVYHLVTISLWRGGIDSCCCGGLVGRDWFFLSRFEIWDCLWWQGGGGWQNYLCIRRVKSSISTGVIPGAPCFYYTKRLRRHYRNGLTWSVSTYINACVATKFYRIYCKSIPYWIISTQAQILFLTQSRAGLQKQIWNTTRRRTFIYHRVITLHLLRLFIATASWFFSPRFFPIPYNSIYQTSSTQITCWIY